MPSFREQLFQARDLVAQTQRRIEQQIILIEHLRSDGYDTAAAERLLASLMDFMTKVNAHRDELEREAEERARDSR
jgi:hypothetical protein